MIVEAQSQRLAVVSTNISGIPELIESGKNGILIDPDDRPALGQAIANLAKDPAMRDQMGSAGEDKVRTQFSHKQTIGELVELLDRSLGNSR